MTKDINKLMNQAYDCIENENFEDALKIYNLVLKKDPKNISALIDKGATLQNIGRLKSALRAYNKALEISPQNIDALLNKGTVLHASQKLS